MKLEVDDLVTGVRFTIRSWKKKGPDPSTLKGLVPDPVIAIMQSQSAPTWGQGEVFEVLAVELPFIAVKCLSSENMGNKSFPLDTREFNMVRVGKNYVEALRPQKLPPSGNPLQDFVGTLMDKYGEPENSSGMTIMKLPLYDEEEDETDS